MKGGGIIPEYLMKKIKEGNLSLNDIVSNNELHEFFFHDKPDNLVFMDNPITIGRSKFKVSKGENNILYLEPSEYNDKVIKMENENFILVEDIDDYNAAAVNALTSTKTKPLNNSVSVGNDNLGAINNASTQTMSGANNNASTQTMSGANNNASTQTMSGANNNASTQTNSMGGIGSQNIPCGTTTTTTTTTTTHGNMANTNTQPIPVSTGENVGDEDSNEIIDMLDNMMDVATGKKNTAPRRPPPTTEQLKKFALATENVFSGGGSQLGGADPDAAAAATAATTAPVGTGDKTAVSNAASEETAVAPVATAVLNAAPADKTGAASADAPGAVAPADPEKTGAASADAPGAVAPAAASADAPGAVALAVPAVPTVASEETADAVSNAAPAATTAPTAPVAVGPVSNPDTVHEENRTDDAIMEKFTDFQKNMESVFNKYFDNLIEHIDDDKSHPKQSYWPVNLHNHLIKGIKDKIMVKLGETINNVKGNEDPSLALSDAIDKDDYKYKTILNLMIGEEAKPVIGYIYNLEPFVGLTETTLKKIKDLEDTMKQTLKPEDIKTEDGDKDGDKEGENVNSSPRSVGSQSSGEKMDQAKLEEAELEEVEEVEEERLEEKMKDLGETQLFQRIKETERQEKLKHSKGERMKQRLEERKKINGYLSFTALLMRI